MGHKALMLLPWVYLYLHKGLYLTSISLPLNHDVRGDESERFESIWTKSVTCRLIQSTPLKKASTQRSRKQMLDWKKLWVTDRGKAKVRHENVAWNDDGHSKTLSFVFDTINLFGVVATKATKPQLNKYGNVYWKHSYELLIHQEVLG